MSWSEAKSDWVYLSYLDWSDLPITVNDDSPDEIIAMIPFQMGNRVNNSWRFAATGNFRVPRRFLPSFLSLVGAKSDESKAYIALNVDLYNAVEVTITAVDETGGGGTGGGGTEAHIAGTVQIDGAAASRDVVVISDDKANGRKVVGEGTSAGDGSFDISYSDWTGAVIALALDEYGQAFETEKALNQGTIVHPTNPNGYVYDVTTAGTTGTEEPVWSTDSSVQSGSVTFSPREFYRPVASGPLQGEVTQTEPEPEATYIEMRIQILDQADSNDYNELVEFEFLDGTGAVIDLAGGSDIASHEHSSFPASNAFDGDTGTRWNSGQNVPTPWIGYQFASAEPVKQIRLTPETLGRAPLKFRIEYSTDTPGTWTEAQTYSTTWPDSTPQTFNAGPVDPDHRFWRLYIHQNNGDNETGLIELEFRSEVGGASIAVNGVVNASHESASYPATNAFDGLTTSSDDPWLTPLNEGDTSDVWISYDLGEGVTAEVVEMALYIYSSARAPADFSLEYSDDGMAWVEVQRWQETYGGNYETKVVQVT